MPNVEPVVASEAPAGSPVVGIGASAGGLEALTLFVEEVPEASGACWVVVQHLSTQTASVADQLLRSHTALPVRTVRSGDPIEPDTILLAPAGHLLTIEEDRFVLTPFASERRPTMSIDAFFASLAKARGRGGYGIVLSGTGTDGSKGVRAIKAAGGCVLAQESGSAQFPGMPESAVATGSVDFVLRPQDMPAKVGNLIEHRRERRDPDEVHREIEGALPAITAATAAATGHDFGKYKTSTLVRRVERRMNHLRISSADRYAELLGSDPDEASRLGQEFLINVTRFFRDPEAFEILRTKAIDPILESSVNAIRVWTPGCSTGEETYSLAMVLREAMAARGERRSLHLFGTDIDVDALTHARAGLYAADAMRDVPEALAKRYFIPEGDKFRVVPSLRAMCIFTPHNLAQDPPFSRLDLVSCRNLMIYLSPELQREVLTRIHFGLRPDGYLLLGPAEGLAGQDDLFEMEDKTVRLFRKSANAAARYTPIAEWVGRPRRTGERAPSAFDPAAAEAALQSIPPSVEALAREAMLREHAPPHAVLTSKGAVVYVSDAMTSFVRPVAGVPSTEIDGYLLRELRIPVRGALGDAHESGRAARAEGIPAKTPDGTSRLFDAAVSPLAGRADLYLLVLQEVSTGTGGSIDDALALRDVADRDLLERENRNLRRQLSAALREHEVSNQELKSSNEELVSTIEELQSSNEELEASREELQSINEELETVNAELMDNNAQDARANSDLRNLFDSTDVAVLFLDAELRVRNYTPATSAIFGLRRRDVGRPITDLSSRIAYAGLEADGEAVIRTLKPVEREVGIAAGGDKTFLMRMRPYRTTDDRIDGITLTFLDITARRRIERHVVAQREAISRQYAELETLYAATPVGLCLTDRDFRYLRVNRRLAEIYGFPVEELIGKRGSDLLPNLSGEIDAHYAAVFATGQPNLGCEIAGETPAAPGVERAWLIDYYPVTLNDEVVAVGACIREITEDRAITLRLTLANERMALLLSELQHRVKNMLATISAAARFLGNDIESVEEYQRRLDDRLRAIASTHDLLTEEKWDGVALSALIAREALPYNFGDETSNGARVSFLGEDFLLTPETTLTVGMAVHELMTNAAKYGALSAPEGRVVVEGSLRPDGTRAFEWRETGGPTLAGPPETSGFGTFLLRRVLGPNVGGGVEMTFAPAGLRATVTMAPERAE